MSSKFSEEVYEFGPFQLSVGQRVLTRNGRRIPLSPTDFDLLLMLVKNSGHVVKKSEILKEIWPNRIIEESNLSQHVYLLRQILSNGNSNERYIENVPRLGYRFISKVNEPASQDDKRPAAPIATLAVLPLINASGDPQAEFLSDGITDAIINYLSQVQSLRVVARSVVFRYKSQLSDPQRIGRELNVAVVFAGTVLSIKDRLAIKVELLDVNAGWQLWGEQYNRVSSDIMEVQEEIAREISEKLQIKLSGKEKKLLTKRHTENAEAYYLHLKGFYLGHKKTLEAMLKSIECFQKAIELDRSYALPYAGLAQAYIMLGWIMIGECSSQEVIPKAKAAAARALEIDDSLAEAHHALGKIRMMFEWDWLGAEKEFKQAIACNANYAAAFAMYGYFFAYQRKFTDAIKQTKRALELEPLSLTFNTDLAQQLYLAGDYDRAIDQCKKTLELDKHFGVTHLTLALAYQQKEMIEEALIEIKQIIAFLGGSSPILSTALARIYAYSDRKKEAKEILKELQQLAHSRYVSPFNIAIIYDALNEPDLFFTWLEKAFKERSSGMVLLKTLPLRDVIRTDPRFAALLRKVGFLTA